MDKAEDGGIWLRGGFYIRGSDWSGDLAVVVRTGRERMVHLQDYLLCALKSGLWRMISWRLNCACPDTMADSRTLQKW
jgi:hypothetical protein